MGAVHFTRLSLISNHSYLTNFYYMNLKNVSHIPHSPCYTLLEALSLSMAQVLNYDLIEHFDMSSI